MSYLLQISDTRVILVEKVYFFNARTRQQMILDGFVYKFHVKRGERSYWKCSSYTTDCRARLVDEGNTSMTEHQTLEGQPHQKAPAINENFPTMRVDAVEVKYECPLCEVHVLPSINALRSHIDEHYPRDSHFCPVSQCGKAFTHPNSEVLIHEPRMGTKISQKAGIWQHFSRATDKKSAWCNKCLKSLKTEGGSTSSLHKHIKTVHGISVEKQNGANSSLSESYTSTSAGQVAVSTASISAKKVKITHFF
nr:unnamed protein product [Callosobruchus chinensis]